MTDWGYPFANTQTYTDLHEKVYQHLRYFYPPLITARIRQNLTSNFAVTESDIFLSDHEKALTDLYCLGVAVLWSQYGGAPSTTAFDMGKFYVQKEPGFIGHFIMRSMRTRQSQNGLAYESIE